MKKKLEDYEPGDVIRGTFYVKSVRKKKREHCLIVLNNSQPVSDSKSHKLCVPACSFSSKVPQGDNRPCLDLSDYALPEDFFDSQKPVTVLRFAEPQCLKAFEVKEYKGNLINYGSLWEDLCALMNQEYPDHMDKMQEVCSCNCLQENDIHLGYCDQDHSTYDNDSNAVCSCCGHTIVDTDCFTQCPICCNTCFVTIVSSTGESIEILYPD